LHPFPARRSADLGVEPTLGPDATGVGWVFEYTLESDSLDLAELRSLQDWNIRFQLTAVPGVSEVASLGGFVRQYQVVVDPYTLLAIGTPSTRRHTQICDNHTDTGTLV